MNHPLPADSGLPSAGTGLLYVYDALCGWCHGFNPVLARLSRAHPDLPVHVISGGMIRGERRGPLGDVAGYIKQTYREVERATEVTFGRAFIDGPLEHGNLYMTSEPPAALLAHVRRIAPHRQLDAAHALQQGIYGSGLGPDSEALARYLAGELQLDADACTSAMTDPELQRVASDDFSLAQRLGVQGFPALFLLEAGRTTLLTSGFTPYEPLVARLVQALSPDTASNSR